MLFTLFISMFIIILFFLFMNLDSVLFVNHLLSENLSNNSISVIILSYKRPHNLKHSLSYLINVDFITEINVYHGSEKYFDDSFQHKKINHVHDYENNEKIFTLRRFLHAASRKTPYTLLLDDDIIPRVSLLYTMLKKCSENKDACVGPIGRYCGKMGYKYPKKKNVVLTPILLAHTHVFRQVWEKMKENQILMNKIIQQKGNCEDLFFQHEYKKFYQKNPLIIKGSYRMLDTSKGFSTTNALSHYMTRNNFCKSISTIQS